MPDYSDSQLLAMVQPKTDWATKLRLPLYEHQGGLPQHWLSAVMQEESGGDPAAVSRAGAKGLFQLMDQTAAHYGVDPFHPQQAAEAATAEFQHLFTKYQGDKQKVLAAWNWGQGNLDAQGLDKAPAETRAFTQRVLGRLGPASAEAAPREWSDAELLGMLKPGPAAPPQPATLRTPAAALVIDIEKPSTPQPPQSSLAATPTTDVHGRINQFVDEFTNQGVPRGGWLGAITHTGLPMAIEGATTALGAAGGALTSPVTGPIGPAVGGALGSYGGRRLNQALGLMPGQPTVLPQNLDDTLALALPLAPLALPAAQQALRYTRGGKALRTAETATADATAAAQQAHADAMAGYEQRLAGDYATRRAQVQNAQSAAQVTTAADLADWRQRGATAYQKAAGQVEETAQQRATNLAAAEQQRQAVERLQGLPGRYLPEVPARNLTDVRRDMAFLEQGGSSADAVVARVGAEDIFDASAKLRDELQTLERGAATREAMQSGESIAPSFKRPEPKLPGMKVEEPAGILSFIAKNGRIKLQGEELQSDFGTMLKGYVNNKSGKTVSEMAQAAHEAGMIPSPDTATLLDAVRDARMPRQQRLDYQSPYNPPTPTASASNRASRVLYERLEEVAGSSPVALEPARDVALNMQAQLGQGIPSAQPSTMQRIVNDLVNMGDRGSVAQVHAALKDLRPLTRSTDGQTRGIAKQLTLGLQQSLEQSAMEWPETAGAAQLVRQAGKAYRQEMAVGELEDILRPGRAVLNFKEGQLTLNPNALLNQFERMANDPRSLFRGSFTPAELAQIRADLHSFAPTPAMPKQAALRPGDAAPLPGLMDVRGLEKPAPTPPAYVKPVAVPEAPTLSLPGAVEPEVQRFRQRHPWVASSGGGGLVASSLATGNVKPLVIAGTLMGLDEVSYWFARAMVSPRWRPHVLKAMSANTTLGPEVYGILGAVAAEEGAE